MRRLLAVAVSAALLIPMLAAISPAAAGSFSPLKDICAKLPQHPGCATPTPARTAAPTPTPVRTAAPTPTAAATPAPTPVRTPSTTPTPAATPTPPPAALAPSATCTRNVNVDSTGATNVTTALQSFVNASPAGSVICFAPGGTYRVDGQLHLYNRTNITLEGRGATIKQTVRGTNPILLIDGGGSGINVRQLTIRGANPSPGVWSRTYEHNHGVAIGGTYNVDLDGVKVINVGGDGLLLSGGAGRWANGIRFHHGVMDGIGRTAVVVTDGVSNAVVDYNTIQRVGYYTFNIEPNAALVGGRLAGGEHIRFSDNTIGTKPFGAFPLDPTQAYGYLFAVTGSSGGGPADDIEVSRNTMTDPIWGSLRIGVFNNGGLRRNIRVMDNQGVWRVLGPTMTFNGVNTLRVTGNRQPLLGGILATVNGCTGVTMSGNTTS